MQITLSHCGIALKLLIIWVSIIEIIVYSKWIDSGCIQSITGASGNSKIIRNVGDSYKTHICWIFPL